MGLEKGRSFSRLWPNYVEEPVKTFLVQDYSVVHDEMGSRIGEHVRHTLEWSNDLL